MTYSITRQDAVQIVSVQALFNELDNKKILNEIESSVQEGLNNLIIDLSRLDFMNSVGLNFLISLMSKSRKTGINFAVANPSIQVVQLLEMTKLKSFFNLSPTVEDALSFLSEN